MPRVTWVLKNTCGGDYLKDVASGVDLGVTCTTERLLMGRNALMDLISSLHGNN